MSVGQDVWAAYNDAQAGRSPRPLLTRALGLTGPGAGRPALDLGCGSGIETRALVAAGWQVTAVDVDPTMPRRLDDLVAGGAVATVVGDLREANLPEADLVHSSYTLPFVPPTHFTRVWNRLMRTLSPRGWLAVDLFGDRDSWCGTTPLTFHDRAAVDRLVQGFEIEGFEEDEYDGAAFGGEPKHWHVFHVVARRRGDLG